MKVRLHLLALAMLSIAAYGEGVEDKLLGVADTSRVHDLEEVIVVTQPKESYLLRKQPLSSTLFSAQDIQRLQASDLRKLSAYVPSFVMPVYGSRYTSSVYVRGIGARSGSPAVGMYLDGLPLMSRSAYNHHTYSLDRVDVLRGPQGTLYGINTEAGMVRMYTLNPFRHQGTQVRLGTGSHGRRLLEASHSTMLSHQLAFTVGGFYAAENGFLRNLTDGKRADDGQEAGGRTRWSWKPSDTFSADLLVDYQYVNQHAFPYGVLHDNGDAESPAATTPNLYRRSMLHTGLTLSWLLGKRAKLTSTTSYQYLRDYMHMDIDYSALSMMRMEEWQQQSAVTQEIVAKGEVPLGEGLQRSWHWTLGGFAAYQGNSVQAPVHFDNDMDKTIATGIQYAMDIAMVNSMAQRFMAQGMSEAAAMAMARQTIDRAGGIAVAADLATIPGSFRTPLLNLAFYHQTSLQLFPRLSATLGLRLDYSRVSLRYRTSSSMKVDVNVMGKAASTTITSLLENECDDHYTQLLPKIGFNWQVDRQGSDVYLSFTKGYRAGGFNHQMFSDILRTELSANSSQRSDYDIPHTEEDYDRIRHTISYKPETTWNLEMGCHCYLFDRSLMLDLSAFHTTVDNQQLSVMAGTYGFGRMMVNAGRSRSLGVEAAMRGKAVDNHFSWTASYGYTHATFRDYLDNVGTFSVVNYRGRRVPYVPRHTAAMTADYRFDFSSSMVKSLTVGADMRAVGSTVWDVSESFSQPFYAVVGASVSAWLGNHCEVRVWGQNLTRTRYNTFAIESAATGKTMRFAQQGTPLQVGVDLNFSF